MDTVAFQVNPTESIVNPFFQLYPQWPSTVTVRWLSWRNRATVFSFGCGGALPQSPPSATDEDKSTKTGSAWGGKVAGLSKEKGQEPVLQWAFIGFNLHRNMDKAHQSLSGSKDQTIDNIQRTLRAYSESGSIS